MKRLLFVLPVMLLGIGTAGCQSDAPQETANGAYDLYDGYLSVEDDALIVDDFIFIDLSNRYWIDTLGLTDADMPNGYFIYDPSAEQQTFSLTAETRYNFYDTGALFVPANDADRLYTTTDRSAFLEKFDGDGDGDLGKTPFTVQVLADGRVLSVSEIFVN